MQDYVDIQRVKPERYFTSRTFRKDYNFIKGSVFCPNDIYMGMKLHGKRDRMKWMIQPHFRYELRENHTT